MSTLVRKRRLGTVRPSASSAVDWGNPLTTALVGAIVVGSDFGVQDLVHPIATPAKTGKWAFGESRLGRSIKFAISNTAGVDLGVRKDWEFGTSTFTVHARVTVPTTGSNLDRYCIISRVNSSSASSAGTNVVTWSLHIRNSSGVFQTELVTATGSGSIAVNTLGSALTAGKQYDLTAVRTGTQIKIYINGVLDNTTSSTALSVRSTSNSFYLGELQSFQTQAFNFSHAYVWNREVTAPEVHSLVAEPFSMMRSFAVSADVQRPPTVVHPAVVVGTATVPSPTLLTSSTVTPAAVVATATVPTVTIPVQVDVSTVVATAAVPSATLSTGSTVTPASVVGTATVPSATVLTPDTTVLAGVVVGVAAVASPTIDTGVTLSVATVVAVAAVPAPILTSTATVPAGPVVALGAVPSPTVSAANLPFITDFANGSDTITTDVARITISPLLQIYLKMQTTRTTLAALKIQSFAYADAPFSWPTHIDAAVINTSGSILFSKFSSDSQFDLFAAESDGTAETQLSRRAEWI